MGYYPKLSDLAREISEWADLRHEQGVEIGPILKRLRKELKRARKELRTAGPDAQALTREPNALDAIRALRPDGPRVLWPKLQRKGLRDRLKGAWLGRAAGCTLGAPVENWPIADMKRLAQRSGMPWPPTDYWMSHPQAGETRYGKSTIGDYLRGRMRCVPVDDDLTYTLLGLLILEDYGPDFTTEQVGRAWLNYLPVACTAEAVALDNLRDGIPASQAGEINNPYQEWIGADIRSDPWGYVAAGWPERAAELAYRDAFLSHRQNGVYGAMFFAAAIAAAFAMDNVRDALEIGLTEIPKDCRLAGDVRWALDTGRRLASWRAARKAVDERFVGMHPVHTNNNACLTVFGLLLGAGDFTCTIGLTVAMGLDNDCTAATAGSLLGASRGIGNIPHHWWKPFRNKTRTYLKRHEWFTNTNVVARFQAAAARVWGDKP